MIHVTCDLCGKPIHAGENHHYVLKMEVFAADEPAPLSEDDLEDDHLEEVSQMLTEMEDDSEVPSLPASTQQRRFDLCCTCRERVLRDPLGKGSGQKLNFSKN